METNRTRGVPEVGSVVGASVGTSDTVGAVQSSKEAKVRVEGRASSSGGHLA